MNAATAESFHTHPPQTNWPHPLTPEEWDRRFPGILDSVGLLGGTANIILQLARLPVGYGVMESKVDSGNIFKRPAKRTRTTLTYLTVAMLGTSKEKLAFRRAVNTAHAQVRSDANAKVAYNAFDPDLQLWVASCAYFGYADMNEKLYGKMSPEKAAEFYRLAEPLGTTLQVRPGMWPADLAAWQAYWEQGLGKLDMDDALREHLTRLTNLEFLPRWQQRLLAPFNRFVTIGMLPPRVRELMRFDWSAAQQKRFDRLMTMIGFCNRLLPRKVRQRTALRMLRDFRTRLEQGKPLV